MPWLPILKNESHGDAIMTSGNITTSGEDDIVSINQIRALWEQVPVLKCLLGCHDCCGPVPWTKAEWEQVKDKCLYDSLDCPYIKSGGCAIYQDRPFLCRLFGAVERGRMKCPHGCGPEEPLSEAQAHELMEQYRHYFSLGTTRPMRGVKPKSRRSYD